MNRKFYELYEMVTLPTDRTTPNHRFKSLNPSYFGIGEARQYRHYNFYRARQ